MNAPDTAPRNGDFARYIEELTASQQFRLSQPGGTITAAPPGEQSIPGARPNPTPPGPQVAQSPSTSKASAARPLTVTSAPHHGAVGRSSSNLILFTVFGGILLVILGHPWEGLAVIAVMILVGAALNRVRGIR